MKMKDAVAYLRVSGKGQVEGGGFSRQIDTIRKYAKDSNFNVVKIYRDEGVSGTLEERPALTRMIVDLQANGVRAVIIERLDRLARDLMVQENLIYQFKKIGIELISALEPDMLSEDPTRKLVRQVLGAISEYEKSLLVLKLRASRERQRRIKGKCEGAKPYGSNSDELKIVGYIKHLRRKPKYGKPMGYLKIANRLNELGILTKRGRTWSAAQIMNICKNSIYRQARVVHQV